MNKKQIITLTEKEIENLSLIGFYDLAAEKLGEENPKENDSIRYDCRKICWSKHIQGKIIDYYKKDGADNIAIGMIMTCSAPKVDDKLKDLEVLIEGKFISYNTN
ncbi:hypothetical protein [Clostridium sp.]|uniref:hypothetical protein n=1 Tax=Clostridium sp. TaxID=1506 RepID=UPI0032175659